MPSQIAVHDNELTLDAIARHHGKLVSAVCRRMIMNEDVARDAAQQVWVEIVKSYPSFRGDSKISTWIYTISRRIAMDHARNEQLLSMKFLNMYSSQEAFEFPVDPDLDKRIWVRQMCDKCITGILHCVDNDTRLAHILRDIVELGYDEIAEVMEKDATTIRQMVSRSRTKINGFLNDKCSLYNTNGRCRCRMKKWVHEIDLPNEYQKIRTITGQVNFYKRSEIVLPGKDYWKNLL